MSYKDVCTVTTQSVFVFIVICKLGKYTYISQSNSITSHMGLHIIVVLFQIKSYARTAFHLNITDE